MSEICNLEIHINGQQTFFLSEAILSKYSGKLRKVIKQEKRRIQIRSSAIEIDDFPGGPDGFELVSRFCFNKGTIPITISNVSILYCCAVFLGMTEKVSRNNLLHQTEVFLEGIFYWSWSELLTCLKSCEPFFSNADSYGLIEKLLCSVLAKVAQKSDINFLQSDSSSSSPETTLSSSPRKAWAWWFQDLTVLGPKMVEQFLRALGCYRSDNSNLVLTRFVLHYLKTANHSNHTQRGGGLAEYSSLADTAVHGVVMGKNAFTCRGLFWVLRIVSGFGLSKECQTALERLIGGMLDQATLDDLLVSGGGGCGVYDVNLVLRLIRSFVHYNYKDKFMCNLDKMRKVGELVDMYLGEIGPDPSLKISKFLGIAESLPDSARDSFDQVYSAIDVYLESHPLLSFEERSRLCRCLNYDKLSLEACKDLAKNPKIPPRIAVQALASQSSTVQMPAEHVYHENDDHDDSASLSSTSYNKGTNSINSCHQLVLYKNDDDNDKRRGSHQKTEDVKVNLERMQRKVVELEKVCREMKGQMTRMVKLAPQHSRPLPRLC